MPCKCFAIIAEFTQICTQSFPSRVQIRSKKKLKSLSSKYLKLHKLPLKDVKSHNHKKKKKLTNIFAIENAYFDNIYKKNPYQYFTPTN